MKASEIVRMARRSGFPGTPAFERAMAMLDAANERDVLVVGLRTRVAELERQVEAQASEIDELIALAVRTGARDADVLEARQRTAGIAPKRR